MQSVLEASKSAQGHVLVRAPAQIFVDESITFVRLQLRAEYSKNTENWTAEKLQQHSLVVNYVELHRSDVVADEPHLGKYLLFSRYFLTRSVDVTLKFLILVYPLFLNYS